MLWPSGTPPSDLECRSVAFSQLFFSFMALALLGVKYKSDKRDQYLHHGNWMVKLALWLAFCVLPFFFPNGLINMYGE